jgi:Domain of unknown function (DUF1906)
MLADQLTWTGRHWRALAIGAVAAALVGPAATSNAAASASTAASASAGASTGAGTRAGTKQVSYRGYKFDVPRGWQVVNLAHRPHSCVRFDKHIVYLGVSGANQHCPSWLIGTTEALQVAPAARKATRSSVEDPVAREITVRAARIRITATFDANPTLIYRILASASLPAPIIRVPHPVRKQLGHAANPRVLKAASTARAASTTRFPHVGPPALPSNVANFRGRGFDACTAPSRSYMRAWRRHSRYRAIGIYIGGSDRACGQRNLTPRWLRTEAAAGWRFVPMYVGPQADINELTTPVREARRAANDAVTQARRLGFGPRTPIYYDMEAYPANRTGEVLRFLSSWTRRLHKLGYKSGAYSSSGSGIADLAQQYKNHRYKMPDVIYDALWNGSKNTKDHTFRKGEWRGHRRLHQYAGDVTQTFGGDTINIDQDFLNVQLPTPGGTRQASQAAAQPDGTVDVFYRGTDHRLWHVGPLSGASAGAPAPVDLGGAVAGQPTAVSPVPGAIDVFYEGSGNLLWEVTRKAGGGWSAPRKISRMGELGSPPAAVAQPNGVVDVFWKGSDGDHLWHGQFSPGKGWKGPQDLRGGLASDPSPVESSPGTVQVFWKGMDGALWHVIRRPGRTWTLPSSIGMGPLGGGPHASARPGGAIDVFWHGSGNNGLWSASFSPGHPWVGARNLRGHLASAPFPLMSPDGRVHVFWKGTDHQLWQVSRGPAVGWGHPYSLHIGPLRAGPFGAIGRSGKSEVFWRGQAGHLWVTMQMAGRTWAGPRDLGGHVG